VEGNDRKRRRLGKNGASLWRCHGQAWRRVYIEDSTDSHDAVLEACVLFAGPGNYRFVAGTCRKMQEQ